MFDTNFKQIGNFEADDIDICVNAEHIAFQKNGKWGFVNAKGKVVLEPQYAKAKSFANGYAAVCNENALWGFINEEYALVIDYQYKDAFYFSQQETCMVSTADGFVQMLRFMFE